MLSYIWGAKFELICIRKEKTIVKINIKRIMVESVLFLKRSI